jgi:SAM-dependent methyltransferase
MESPAAEVGADWTESLEAPFRQRFIDAIRSLKFGDLQRYPPPKMGGLPFGHELRILRRFAIGGSSMLDQSAFSSAYRVVASPMQRLTYRGLVIGEELTHQQWAELVGADATAEWVQVGLLAPGLGGGLRARFRAIAASGLVLIVDPLDESFRFRVHIGQDSLNMAEFLTGRNLPADARVLDVGTGSGILLMTTARGRREGVGVDINPRAVRLASFNAELNGLTNCRVELRDVFEESGDLGRFDVVTWNTPFMFFPESWKEASVDGYGGHLGIEIPLRFVDALPSLLSERGIAFVLAAGPRMHDGGNRLDEELIRRARPLGIDIVAHVLQTFWFAGLRDFYNQHGVEHFESEMLEITPGTGLFVRREPPVTTAAADVVRRLIYKARAT